MGEPKKGSLAGELSYASNEANSDSAGDSQTAAEGGTGKDDDGGDGDPDEDRRHEDIARPYPANTSLPASSTATSRSVSTRSKPPQSSHSPDQAPPSSLRSRRRDWMAFILILFTLGLGVFFAEEGHDSLALITLTGVIYQMVQAFIKA